MKKFIVLYMAKSEDFKKMMEGMKQVTGEAQKTSMEEWKSWAEGAGMVDMGAGLGKTKKVTSEGASDIGNEIGGYSFIEAESHDAAAEKMKDSPHFTMMPGGWIELMEVMPM